MFVIYVAGVSEGGSGGIGITLLKRREIVKEYSISLADADRSRAELAALVYSIRVAQVLNEVDTRELIIYTNSEYLYNMANHWIFRWKNTGWKKSDGKEPLHLDLVKSIYDLLKFERAVKIEKVLGFETNQFNKNSIKLAEQALCKALDNCEDWEKGRV